MKSYLCILALIGITAYAQQAQEYTYDWLVDQYKQHNSIEKIPGIKKHVAVYTKLVESDLKHAYKNLHKKLTRSVLLATGGYVTLLGLKDMCRNMLARYKSFTVFAISLVKVLGGLCLLDYTTQDYTQSKDRIAFDNRLLAQLYAVSIT